MQYLTSVAELFFGPRMRPVHALIVLGLLSACGTIEIRSPPRAAIEMATRVVFSEHDSAKVWCFGVVERGGRGSSVQPPVSGEMTVGFENSYDPGTEPFPCDFRYSRAYQGAFRFDLEDIRGKFVTGAWLQLWRRDTDVPVAVEPPSRGQCFIDIEIARESFDPGFEEGRAPGFGIDSDPIRPDPDYVFIGPGVHTDNANGLIRVRVPVRNAVHAWASGPRRNFGFVIKPQPVDVAQNNNNTCTGYYFDPTLEINYLDRPPEGP